jgi:hypothetical protein
MLIEHGIQIEAKKEVRYEGFEQLRGKCTSTQ